MRPTWKLLSLAPLLLSACATTLGSAKDAFERGQYPRAKEELLAIADEVPSWDAPKQARYAVYLGLTHAELGDTTEAKRWLVRAQSLEDAHPGTLPLDDWRRLQLGLAAVEPPASVTP